MKARIDAPFSVYLSLEADIGEHEQSQCSQLSDVSLSKMPLIAISKELWQLAHVRGLLERLAVTEMGVLRISALRRPVSYSWEAGGVFRQSMFYL